MSESGRTRAFWALLVLALALRLGYGLMRAPLGAAAPNPDRYTELARGFARTGTVSEAGKEGVPSAHREPVYPVYLGAWFKVFGPTQGAVLLANALLTVLFFLAFHATALVLFGPRTALLACVVAAVYPPFLYYAALPLRETAMMTFSVCGMWSVIAARRRGTLTAFAAAGAAAALAPLTNTTLLPFFLVCVPAGLAWMERARLAWAARRGFLYAAVLVAVYALWPLRNWMAFHTWIVGSLGSAAGANLYIYQVVPQEYGGTPRQGEILAADPVIRVGATLGEVESEHWYLKAGAAKIRENPLAYARLVCWRFFVDTWRLWPRPRGYEHSYRAIKAVSILSDGWIIPLGLLGMVLAAPVVPEAVWLCSFVLSTALLYALVFTMLRYRFSLMPWLILFAAEALLRLKERLRPPY